MRYWGQGEKLERANMGTKTLRQNCVVSTAYHNDSGKMMMILMRMTLTLLLPTFLALNFFPLYMYSPQVVHLKILEIIKNWINGQCSSKVLAVEMSCPWLDNRARKPILRRKRSTNHCSGSLPNITQATRSCSWTSSWTLLFFFGGGGLVQGARCWDE